MEIVMSEVWLMLPVFLPVLLGLIFPFIKCLNNRQRRIGYIGTSLVLCGVLSLAVICNLGQDASFTLWSMTEELTITFRVDGMSKVFAVLTTFVWVTVGFYAFGYMKHEEEEEKFYRYYLIVYGVLLGLDFSANLISMYLFYEMMTLSSLPLVLHSRTKEAVMAGLKYLFYSIAGAFLSLLAIFFFYQYGTTMEFTAGGVLDMAKVAGNEQVLLLVIFLAIVGFGCKAGMFPLHAWLPTAHPVAPSPASAVLSGIITKAGVLAIIRVVFYIVGADFIRGTWVQYAWIGLSLFTVFMGSMLAYLEPLLKKRLAYSSVSQVSYVLFGLSVLHPVGALGALLHVVFHSLIKNTLFLTAGSIIEQTGCKRVDELTGIGKKMPGTIWCLTLAGLALVGVPPLSGFVSKWYLASGALQAEIGFLGWLGPVVLLISALLTAGYLFPITMRGFLPGNSEVRYERCEVPKIMLVPTILLTLGAVLLGIFASPLTETLNKLIATFL